MNRLGMNNSQLSTSNESKLLRKIQEVDFSLYETVLYLDAYPDCAEALNYYHSLLNTRETLAAEYQKKYGPLTAFSNTSHSSWDWVKTPWPWQL